MPLIPTTPEHVEQLAAALKPDHQRELNWFGMGNRAGVRASVAACGGHTLSAVTLRGEKLLFIAGVQSSPGMTPDAAVIVYLATTDFDTHMREALRMTRVLFEEEVWRHTAASRLEQYLPPAYGTGILFLEKFLGWTRGQLLWVGGRQARHMYFERGG